MQTLQNAVALRAKGRELEEKAANTEVKALEERAKAAKVLGEAEEAERKATLEETGAARAQAESARQAAERAEAESVAANRASQEAFVEVARQQQQQQQQGQGGYLTPRGQVKARPGDHTGLTPETQRPRGAGN